MRLLVVIAVTFASPGLAQTLQETTSLTCQSNGKAWRDWGFTERSWQGVGPQPFGTVTTRETVVEHRLLRDRVFSGLHTASPIVRSITPPDPPLFPADTAEFKARVLVRTTDHVFMDWSNGINKTWSAVIDLKNKRAIVVHTYAGATSLGGELETLDCR